MAQEQPIVIKKVKKGGGHGHHGGAWKVAYADFVTAMMAFFLLMWLINTTSPEQRRGIADYFAPASVSPTTSGSGGLLAGTEFGREGVRGRGSHSVVERPSPQQQDDVDSNAAEGGASDRSGAGPDDDENAVAAALARRDEAVLRSAELSLRQALQELPEIAELSKSVILDQTPDGLRIQLIDQEGRPMFAAGSAEPTERARLLLDAVVRVVEPLSNRITIAGHTDSAPSFDPSQSNWQLSSDRANAARRLLQAGGLDAQRLYQIVGKADSDPLFPDDPYQPGNRRVSITLMREAPVVPPDLEF